MAKHARCRAEATALWLEPSRRRCPECDGPLWVAYPKRRTVVTLQGLRRLHLKIRCCETPACPAYHRPYHPEEEGGWVLPRCEIGLDVIAHVGARRYAEHRSVPEIHQDLQRRGVSVCERS